MKRPPWLVVVVALVMIALGETSGAVMSQARAPFADWARARIAANPTVHGFAGSAEYDEEVTGRTVFAAEAGLSFFHTHAEGVGVIVFVVGTVIATVVPWTRARAGLQALVALGGLFPLGYLVYAIAVVERGREAGVELAERWVLTPLGSAMIAALVGVVVVLAISVGRRAS
ncbi:MAG: hypothetical protein HYU41_11035 [Candidatus Rokubacteria bacterium]|nr:hypothetical protein [Candidatus Rokubacteria bacterium]